ncbi:MAG: proline iminopeptidase [Planctomycetota bacterium]|jgi:proline iminopeptidase
MNELHTLPVAPGIEIAYRVAGDRSADARPLFVPAMSWLERDLDGLFGGRTVVFFDVRGRGRSSRVDDLEKLGLGHDVADLELLRAHLAQDDARMSRIDLMGWSYYGGLVAQFALDQPDSTERLVLVGPTPPRSKPWFGRFLDNFARRVDLPGLHKLEQDKRAGLRDRDPLAYGRRVHGLFHRAYLADEKHLARMRSDPCVEPNADTDRVNDQARRVIEKLGAYDWRDELGALHRPTLIVHGQSDPIPFEASEEWCQHLPSAQLTLLEDVGHMPWLEAPESFFRHVNTFLSRN